MELKKHPETELECSEAIESLGGYMWSTKHGISHGHIEDPDGKVEESIINAHNIQKGLVKEISEKFNVIPPENYPEAGPEGKIPTAPEGKIYYSDWYKKMKGEAYKSDYEKIICSACPFSEGLESMISNGGTMPCSVFRGVIHRLQRPYICAMVSCKNWSEGQLSDKIEEKAGLDALKEFYKKLETLKNDFLKSRKI